MKLSRILPRFVPFILTLLLGIALTVQLRDEPIQNEPRPISTKPLIAPTSPGERPGWGTSGGPFVPPGSKPANKSALKIISKPQAAYTDQARANNVQGAVRLKVTLLASGQVGSITVVNGLPDGLTDQAIAAARRIQFVPATVNGVPASRTITIDYSFAIY